MAYFSDFLQVQISDYVASGGSDQSPIFWLWIMVLMGFTLIKPLGLALFLWGTEESLTANLSWESINDTLKENLRAIGSVLTWSLLLVIPGFVRFFQLWWVPWVTLSSPSYQAGQIDALRASRLFFKFYAKRLLFLVLLFEMVLPLLLENLTFFYGFKFIVLGVLQFAFYYLVHLTWKKSQQEIDLKELWGINH